MAAERKKRAKKKKAARKCTPKKSAAELAIERRREKVANLRLAAWSIRDIAAHLKCSVGTVHSDIAEVFERTQDASAEATKRDRALSLERLDVAMKGLWDRIEAGDDDAVDRLVKLEARRAKLLGLDAPTRNEHSGPDGGPIAVEAKNALSRKLDDLGKRLAAGTAQPGGTPGAEPSSES